MNYIRDSKKPIYVSREVGRWLHLLAKAESDPEINRIMTADEIADQILRQAIREQHPQLAEHQKAIDTKEKQLIESLRFARENKPLRDALAASNLIPPLGSSPP